MFPFENLFPSGQLTKLLRLFRLPRLIKLIDIDKFQNVIQSLTTSGDDNSDEKLSQKYMMLYVYKIVRLIIIAIIITYFIGCGWFLICTAFELPDATKENTFTLEFGLRGESISNSHRLIVSCYYALTTLSTVGYGDYYPISNSERIVAVLIMLGGVAFFSYIMGNFIEIISNYEKKMGIEDKSGDLHNWLLQLTRFSNNSSLPKSLTLQIEDDFSHYWLEDRVSNLNNKDESYLFALPKKIKQKIMTKYLFSDVF